ncbi:hypothetical protein JS562_31510, partial [Agrobacterium sp. S2]|nr:hypothetical protein [Agrobacterium sp. S2]
MIFLDTNVISETLNKASDSAVIAWPVRHDAELALPMVAVAGIAFGIQKIRPDQRRSSGRGTCELAAPVLRQDVCLRKKRHWPMEISWETLRGRGVKRIEE